MEKRQAELEKLMLEYEKQCLKDLQKAYTEALADVKRNLKGLLGSEQTQSIVYQGQFQESLQRQIESALNTLKNGSITSVSDFLSKTYEDSYLGTIYSIQGQGIPINIGIDHEQMARTISRRTDTMQFSQRIYDNVDRLGTAFKSQMSRGIANNSTYSKIAKQLAMESEANYRQAMRIVRTEGGRVKSEAKLNSMKAAKDEGADIVKQWDATFDGKTRAEHRYLDGQIREIDEPFTDSQGREAQAPHKFGVAAMDINCRCIVVERARWAVEGEEMPNKVDNATGDFVEAKNYRDWKEKYQKKQAEEKPTSNNAKVFDKNSKSLPNKDDYFKTTSGELVKIKEVNDYNGIKSVSLENGQNIVLGNVKDNTIKTVTKEQQEIMDNAVEYYVSGEGMYVNNYLAGKTVDGIRPEEYWNAKEDNKLLKALDDATTQQEVSNKTLYRSVDASAIFQNASANDLDDIKDELFYGQAYNKQRAQTLIETAKGSVIKEPRFLSTTKDKEIALSFGDFTGAEHPLVIEFEVPQGIRGYDVSKKFEVKNDPQKEVLLQRNLRYEILDIGVQDSEESGRSIYVKARFITN